MRIAEREDDLGGLELQMAPMVDVVFLLLIFFLLATHIALREVQVRSSLRTLGAQESAELTAEATTIVIRLEQGPAGRTIRLGNVRCTTFEELQQRLTDIALPELPVLLISDAGLAFDVLARAIDTCLASGYKDLSLGTP